MPFFGRISQWLIRQSSPTKKIGTPLSRSGITPDITTNRPSDVATHRCTNQSANIINVDADQSANIVTDCCTNITAADYSANFATHGWTDQPSD
jgi:hypothetical protein